VDWATAMGGVASGTISVAVMVYASYDYPSAMA